MAKIIYSGAAIKDLEQIGDYIAQQLKSPQAALNTVNRIQDSIDKLDYFPLIGAPVASIIKIDTDYRFLVCGNYLAFYHQLENDVMIDRILYSRRDYLTILFGNLSSDDID